MAKKTKEKVDKKGRTLVKPKWSNFDERDKDKFILTVGLVLGVLALFTILAVVSYLFTWKSDMSLLNDPSMKDVQNLAGKLGFKWSYFLVKELFGLGSLAFGFILGVYSVRLLRRKSMPLLKLTLSTVSLALIASFILAYISGIELFNLSDVYGGGLGGDCGSAFVTWLSGVAGSIITLVVLLILAFVWVVFAIDPKFDFKKKVDEDEDEAEEEKKSESDVDDDPDDLIDDESGRTEVKFDLGEDDDKEEDDDVSVPSGDEQYSYEEEPLVVPEVEDPFEELPVGQTSVSGESQVIEVVPENPVTTTDVASQMEVITDDTLSAEVEEELPRINIRDELPRYEFPPLDLLDDYASSRQEVSSEELTRNNNKIRATLANYKISVDDVKAIVGPTVTLYKVYPSAGVKISAIKGLQDDIAMYLHAKGVRVVKLPDSVGIEVANDVPSTVPLKATLNDAAFRESDAELPVAIGYTISQKVKVFDLADAPHLLVAGATKQGKSVGLNVIVGSLLYAKHPSELKFVFIDPKMVEFSSYARLLKHYLAVLPNAANEQDERDLAIVKKAKPAGQILKSLCIEMDERYELLSKAYVNNIKLYNEKYKERHLLPTEGHHFLPYIVVVIDEYADLTMSVDSGSEAKNLAKGITNSIVRLAQKGRAAGIHVILATQRPSVDVITGLIKTNFPTRIAFRVSSRVDSATIIDSPGADKLIGRGDMLFYAGVETERVQCAYISNDEINRLTSFIGDQSGYKKCYNTPYYLPEPDPQGGESGEGGMIDMKNLDERFEEAAKLVVMSQKGSTSDIQRRLGMGYAKAGRVMDQLEAAGIVGPQEGSKPRQVLVGSLDELDRILQAYLGQ